MMNQKIDYHSRFGLVMFFEKSNNLTPISVIAVVLRIDSKII